MTEGAPLPRFRTLPFVVSEQIVNALIDAAEIDGSVPDACGSPSMSRSGPSPANRSFEAARSSPATRATNAERAGGPGREQHTAAKRRGMSMNTTALSTMSLRSRG